PFKRSASERSALSPIACTCNVRVIVSGLYCNTMMRLTTDVSGSSKTMPPLRLRGDLGKDDIYSSLLVTNGSRKACASQLFVGWQFADTVSRSERKGSCLGGVSCHCCLPLLNCHIEL